MRYRYIGRTPTELASGRIVSLHDFVTNISSEDGSLVDRGLLVEFPEPPLIGNLDEETPEEKPAPKPNPKLASKTKDK